MKFNNKKHPHLELSDRQVGTLLVVIILLSFAYSASNILSALDYHQSYNHNYGVNSLGGNTLTPKERMLERVSHADTQPLSSREKSSVVEQISTGNTYTAAEKDAIIRALQ